MLFSTSERESEVLIFRESSSTKKSLERISADDKKKSEDLSHERNDPNDEKEDPNAEENP